MTSYTDPATGKTVEVGSPEHVELWDAINAYVAACGGNPTRGGVPRMKAVVRVEKAVQVLVSRGGKEVT